MGKRASRDFLIAIGAVVVVALCGYLVRGGQPLAFERPLFEAINGLPGFLAPILWAPMQFGNFVVVPLVAAAALLLKKWRLAIAVALVGAGKYTLEMLVKDIVVRHRPAQIVEEVVLRGAPASGRGFLSGHAVVAVGLATVLHPYLGTRGRIVVWTLAATVVFGRVYVGAHLPVDVVAGAALGLAIGSLANVVTRVRHDAEKVQDDN